MTRNSVIFFVIVFLVSGCWPTRDLKNFTLYGETQGVDPAKLKIDGVYYTIEDNYVKCFVLYENGTYLNLIGHKIDSSIENSINMLISHFEKNKELYAESISGWGAFAVLTDTLHVQQYQSLQSPNTTIVTPTSKVFNSKMKILNNSTLLEIGNKKRTYSLYETNDKPDSTNIFMANQRIRKKLLKLYKKRHKKKLSERN